MLHLTDFVEWLNSDVGGNGPLPNLLHGDYGVAMADSLSRHFAEDRQKGGVRMSNLGKPATLLALAKLGYIEPEPKGKSRLIFHMGDMYENFLEILMQAYGIEILDSQRELEWKYGLTGHLDYIIKSPVTGKPLIVEAKTMSDNYARLFSRRQDDDRGYITQLGLYSTCTGYDSTWLCLNKGNATTFEIETNPGLFMAALERAEKVMERLQEVNTLDDVLAKFRPPPPQKEVYQRKETGDYLLPMNFRWSPFRNALYKTYEQDNNYGKPTIYVEGYADTEHMKRELDKLVDSGMVMYEG